MIYKAIIFVALSLHILLSRGEWFHQTCNVDIAKLAIPPVIWYEQTIDGREQSHTVTRILHNKPGVFLNQFGKCYFQNIEPYLLYKTIGFVGMLSVFYLFYIAIDAKKYLILAILAFIPTLPFLGLSITTQILLYKLLSLAGVIIFLKNTNGKK